MIIKINDEYLKFENITKTEENAVMRIIGNDKNVTVRQVISGLVVIGNNGYLFSLLHQLSYDYDIELI